MLVALPGHQLSPPRLRHAVWTSLRFELFSITIVLCGVVGLTVADLPQTRAFGLWQLMSLALAAIFPMMGTHTAYFRLVNRYNTLMLAGFLSNLMKLICLGGVSHFAPSVPNMVLAFAVPEFIRCLFLFGAIVFWKRGLDGPLDESKVDLQKIRNAGKWSTLQAICELPVAQLDRVIIGFVLPGQMLGVFAILKRIYALVNLATSPFYSTTIPEFAALANAGDIRGAFALWIKTMKLLAAVTFAAALGCMATSFIWMPLVFPVLQNHLLEFGIVLVSAVVAGTFVTSHSLYWALGKLRQTTVISVTTNLIYLGVLGLMTWQLGLAGAVGAFLVHVLLAASIKIFLLKKVLRGC